MLTLTEEQRDHLRSIVDGNQSGSYFAASIVLQLAEGKEPHAVANAAFCEQAEVEAIAALFQRGGVAAVQKFEG